MKTRAAAVAAATSPDGAHRLHVEPELRGGFANFRGEQEIGHQVDYRGHEHSLSPRDDHCTRARCHRSRRSSAPSALLADGATIPFIARYRKEVTGDLDEVQIGAIDERAHLPGRARRAQGRPCSPRSSEQGKLTDELQARIVATLSKTELEDLYLPYKPKRRTRATIARERGLEPLAERILAQETPAGRRARRWPRRSSMRPRRCPTSRRPSPARATSSPRRSPSAPRCARRCASRRSRRRAGRRRGDRRQGGGGREVQGLLRLARAGRRAPVASPAGDAARRGGGLPARGARGRRATRARDLVRHKVVTAPKAALAARARGGGRRRLRAAAQDRRSRSTCAWSSRSAPTPRRSAVFAENLRDLLLRRRSAASGCWRSIPAFAPAARSWSSTRRASCSAHDGDLSRRSRSAQVEEAAATLGRAVQAASHRGDRHRQRHRAGARPRPSCASSPPRGALGERQDRGGQRGGRVGLLGVGGRARGVPRPGRDGARRGLDRAAAAGSARRAGEDRSQVDRRRPVPARRPPADAQEGARRRGRELRQPRRRRAQHRVGEAARSTSPGVGETLAKNIVAHRDENGPFRARSSCSRCRASGPKAFEQAAGFLRIRGGEQPARRLARCIPRATTWSSAWRATSASTSPGWSGDAELVEKIDVAQLRRRAARPADAARTSSASWRSRAAIRAPSSRRSASTPTSPSSSTCRRAWCSRASSPT